jgi:oxygen-dependent protoporphyrinogen oxidase
MKAAVIGAGISGLSAAYHIKEMSKKSGPEIQVTIFEKENCAGGTISTVKENGYLLETGPNGFLDSKKSTLELISQLGLGGSLERSNRSSARRYIYNGKKLMMLPDKPQRFLTTPMITLSGKLRVMMEPLIAAKKSDDDESVASFVLRRIGRQALDNLVGPMVSGIYAGDPEQLSLKSAFPRMYELEREYGSLIKAMMKLRRGGAPPGTLTSFNSGMGTLIEALTAALGDSVKTGVEISLVEKTGNRWKVSYGGTSAEFDAVVTAVPAYVLGRILPEAAEECAEIYYPPLTVVHLGYKNSAVAGKTDGFGFLTTKTSGTKVLGAIFSSNIFIKRAPEGYSLVTSMVGGANFPENAMMPRDKMLTAVCEGIERIAGIKGAPDFWKIFPHEKAIPNYPVGHPDAVKKLENKMEKMGGIFLAGNAFYGVGINDATLKAGETAARAAAYLKGVK